jgi:hypothetical protein
MRTTYQLVCAASSFAVFAGLLLNDASAQVRSEADTASRGAAILQGGVTSPPRTPYDGKLASSPSEVQRSEAQAATHGAAVLRPDHQPAPPMQPEASAPPMSPRSAAETAAHGRDVSR